MMNELTNSDDCVIMSLYDDDGDNDGYNSYSDDYGSDDDDDDD